MSTTEATRPKQILVAAVGNLWLRDDGFGGEVATRLGRQTLPPGLRFVKAVGGWPGKVIVIACEPRVVEEMGIGLSPEVEGVVDRAVAVVAETIEEIRKGLVSS